MFERFTGQARDAVLRAVEEAERRGSPVVGTEHMLLALTGERSPRTAEALAGAGIGTAEIEQILEEVQHAARRGGLDQADAEALAALGIDLDAIVDGIEREHGEGALVPPAPRPLGERILGRARAGAGRTRRIPPDARRFGGHKPFTPEAKKVLERALRECLAQESGSLTIEHVLLGVAGTEDVVGRALTARGAGTSQLRTWFATHPAESGPTSES